MQRGIIYKLVDPAAPNVAVYVGETCVPLQNRLLRHVQQAVLTPRNVSAWIAGLLPEGRYPLIIALEECFGTRAMQRQREDFWIAKLRSEGHPLMNVPKGPTDPLKLGQSSKEAWARCTPERRAERGRAISKALGGEAKGQRCEQILQVMRDACGPIKYAEIVRQVGVKASTLGNDMRTLQERGLIRREGNTHHAVWCLI